MTDNEMRVAIAEACGWKPEIMLRCAKCDTCYEAEPNKDYSAGVLCPECRSKGYVMVGVCHAEPIPGSEMPDYLSDLNAMREAEKILNNSKDASQFADDLIRIVLGYHPDSKCEWVLNRWELTRLAHASASQRAEALLKTIGKWKAN